MFMPTLGGKKYRGMEYVNTVSMLNMGCGGELSVFAKALSGEREPGHRGDDFCFDFTCLQQFSQTCLNKNSVNRSNGTWKKRREQ